MDNKKSDWDAIKTKVWVPSNYENIISGVAHRVVDETTQWDMQKLKARYYIVCNVINHLAQDVVQATYVT